MSLEEQDPQMHEVTVDFGWTKTVYMPVVSGLMSYPVYEETPVVHECKFSIVVQGNLAEIHQKPVFLTVHDIGKGNLSFVKFVNSEPMAQLKRECIFLHVSMPGQEPNAEDLDGEFPSVDQLGDGLAKIIDHFHVSKCIVIGEGAGADIVCRFAMHFSHYVKGLVLIHCTSTTHGIMEHAREIFMNLRLDDGQMNESAWKYLFTHRFGNHSLNNAEQKLFMKELEDKYELNKGNLSRYIYSFAHRADFTDELEDNMANIETFLLTGGKSAHNDNVQHMYKHMPKAKTSLFVAENCVDLLEEAPDYLASALILLCHHGGTLLDLEIPTGHEARTNDDANNDGDKSLE